jgi:hypothetical protein
MELCTPLLAADEAKSFTKLQRSLAAIPISYSLA